MRVGLAAGRGGGQGPGQRDGRGEPDGARPGRGHQRRPPAAAAPVPHQGARSATASGSSRATGPLARMPRPSAAPTCSHGRTPPRRRGLLDPEQRQQHAERHQHVEHDQRGEHAPEQEARAARRERSGRPAAGPARAAGRARAVRKRLARPNRAGTSRGHQSLTPKNHQPRWISQNSSGGFSLYGSAVQVRHQEVAAHPHLPGHGDIAGLVDRQDRAQRERERRRGAPRRPPDGPAADERSGRARPTAARIRSSRYLKQVLIRRAAGEHPVHSTRLRYPHADGVQAAGDLPGHPGLQRGGEPARPRRGDPAGHGGRSAGPTR